MALGSITSNNHHQHNHPYQRQQIQQRSLSTYQQQPRAIAPAPIALQPAVNKTTSEKYYGGASGTTLDSNNPAVVRRNARERNRVKQVNNGFTYLRQHLPPAIIADLSNGRRGIGPGAHKKLSKVDTLRMAVEYIRRLQRVIDEVDGKRASAQATGGLNNSWPNNATSATNSPPPTPPKKGMDAMLYADKIQQHFTQSLSYQDALQQQEQQQQFINLKYQQPQLPQQYFNQYPAMISPAGSVSSSTSINSSDCNNSDASTLYRQQPSSAHTTVAAKQQFSLPFQMKYEQQYNEEPAVYSSGDEEDLLDYISLWQDEV